MGFSDEFDDFMPRDVETSELKEAPTGISVTLTTAALQMIANTVGQRVEESLMKTLLPKINKSIDDKIDELIQATCKETILTMAAEAISKYINEPRHRTDQWGIKHGPTITMQEEVVKMVDDFMKERVDSNGNRSAYQDKNYPTRVQWMLKKFVHDDLKVSMENSVKDVTEQARRLVQQQIGAFVAEKMIPAIELKR